MLKITLMFCLVSLTQAEMYSSMEAFRHSFEAQGQLAQELQTYLDKEYERLAQLEKAIVELENEVKLPQNEIGEKLADPVQAFQILRKSRGGYLNYLMLMPNVLSVEAVIAKAQPLLNQFATEEDLTATTTALLRLQDTYKVSAAEFADGILPGLSSSNQTARISLSAKDCFDIAVRAYAVQDYYHTAIWAEEALERMANEEYPDLDRAEVLGYAEFSNYKIGNVFKALKQVDEILLLQPDHPYAYTNRDNYMTLLNPRNINFALHYEHEVASQMPVNSHGSDSGSADLPRYEQICRGEQEPLRNAHLLYCDYATNQDPRLFIAPLKREVASFEPLLIRYYEVITDKEIKFLIDTAKPRLDRGGVFGTEKTDYRITRVAWLRDDEDVDRIGPFRNLFHRISAMTQLNMANVEPFQVANYGVGGHYTPHYDYARPGDQDGFGEHGNRIGTLIFYLTDVAAGGGTAFTAAGVLAEPLKGSAAFWFNLKKSTEVDERTLHGACPVLVGVKWVATKWFHARENEFWHQCSLDREAQFTMEDLQGSYMTYQRQHERFNFP